MKQSFSPWSTDINTGNNPQLSTFWKRRLTMLTGIRHKRPNISRREFLCLFAFCLIIATIPTFQGKAVSAPQAEKTTSPKTAIKPDSGLIYVKLMLKQTDPDDPNSQFNGIVAINPVTGTFEKLGIENGHSFRISPDGETVAYADGGAIWTNNLKGTSPGKILDFSGRPIWSPDSKQILASNGKSTPEDKDPRDSPAWNVQSWRTDLFGDNRIRLDIPEADFIDDWSPDGKWLVTSTDRHPPYGSGYQLYLMKPDGTEERRLTQGRGLNVYARFSPDSKKIAYLHQRGANNIRIVDIDGKNNHAVLTESGVASPDAVAWSPDGKRLAILMFDWQIDEKGKKFLSDPTEADYRIVIMDADGKNQRKLKLDTEAKITWMKLHQWR